MIITNTIKFGYGSILITTDTMKQKMIFRQMVSPLKCGTNVNISETKFIGNPIILKIDINDFHNLIVYIDAVKNRKISKFEYGGYVFDFEKYNEESAKIFENALVVAMSAYLMCLAA